MNPTIRLAKLVIGDPTRALEEASRLLDAHQAKRKRVLVKSKPRREKESAAKVAQRARTTEVRGIVFTRAGGSCECCRAATPTELHHVLSGPDRRTKEQPRSCAALCRPCHLAIHRNDLDRLHALLRWAVSYQFTYCIAALQRRIDKLRAA
jgi:hypothetical protein